MERTLFFSDVAFVYKHDHDVYRSPLIASELFYTGRMWQFARLANLAHLQIYE